MMSETKWTPGPWEPNYGDGITGPRAAPAVYWGETDIVYIPVRHGRDVVCWIATSPGTEDNLLPDAQLIAAAPELYAALAAIAGRTTANWTAKLTTARAALAKARGESA